MATSIDHFKYSQPVPAGQKCFLEHGMKIVSLKQASPAEWANALHTDSPEDAIDVKENSLVLDFNSCLRNKIYFLTKKVSFYIVLDFNNCLANKINMASKIQLRFILISLDRERYIGILQISVKM